VAHERRVTFPIIGKKKGGGKVREGPSTKKRASYPRKRYKKIRERLIAFLLSKRRRPRT